MYIITSKSSFKYDFTFYCERYYYNKIFREFYNYLKSFLEIEDIIINHNDQRITLIFKQDTMLGRNSIIVEKIAEYMDGLYNV